MCTIANERNSLHSLEKIYIELFLGPVIRLFSHNIYAAVITYLWLPNENGHQQNLWIFNWHINFSKIAIYYLLVKLHLFAAKQTEYKLGYYRSNSRNEHLALRDLQFQRKWPSCLIWRWPGFWSSENLFLWIPESLALESRIQLKESSQSGVLLTTGIWISSPTDKNQESGMRNPKRGIQNPRSTVLDNLTWSEPCFLFENAKSI